MTGHKGFSRSLWFGNFVLHFRCVLIVIPSLEEEGVDHFAGHLLV